MSSREFVLPRASTRVGLLLAIVVVAVAVRAGSLIGPFGSGWQHLGATYSIIARNYLRYGLADTRLMPVLNPEPAPPEQWTHFTHHPPGMGLVTAAAMQVIGDGPLAIRLLGLVFSLLQVVVTYALVARAFSPIAGLAAAFATAVLPAGACYATHGSDLGPQAIALALFALLLDERARERDPVRPRNAAVLAMAAASLYFGWPALVIVGVIGLRDLARKDFRRAALFLAVPPIALALHAFHLKWATGSFAGDRGGSLFTALLSHGVVGASSLFEGVGGDVVVSRVLRHVRFLFTDTGLVLAALGLVAIVVLARRDAEARRGAEAPRPMTGPLLGTIALAFGYTLPFARAVVVHRFWLIVALPLIALLIGAAIDGAWRRRALRPIAVLALLAMGALATQVDLATQASERTPFYEELGGALRTTTRSGEKVLTTEHVNGSLSFYAERTLDGDLQDSLLESFRGEGREAPLMPAWIAIAQPPFDPKIVDCDDLLAFLPSNYLESRIELPRSGRTLFLFDLSRRP